MNSPALQRRADNEDVGELLAEALRGRQHQVMLAHEGMTALVEAER